MKKVQHTFRTFLLGCCAAFVAMFLLSVGIAQVKAATPAEQCRADINSDGFVDLSDYSILVSNFLKTSPTNPRADINSDNFVDLSDYSLLVSSFLSTPTNCSGTTPDPTPPTLTNLLSNPGFESGSKGSWSGGTSTVTNAQKHTGTYSLKVTGWDEQSQTVSVTSGKKYTFTGWFMYTGALGDGYGQTRFEVNGQVLTNYHENMVPNQWYKLAITFTATSNQANLKFGLWGPKSTPELYYDDFMLFESATNLPPVVKPTASVSSGQAPLSVQFTANEDDYDGAVTALRWNFGDGSEDTIAKPSHTYISAGNFTATVTATDNNGAVSSKSLTVNVTNSNTPTVAITSPASTDSFTTSNSSITLSGTSTTSTGQINQIVWDNVNTDEVGVVTVTPGQSVNWNAGTVALKPGKNEFLVTSTTTGGTTAVDRIIITRQISAPAVRNISANTSSPKVYEKYELTFDVDTVADQYMFMYDPNPPAGAQIYSGVTVEGVVKKPDGSTVTHPAFYMSDVTYSSANKSFTDSGVKHWRLRISPQQTGNYQVSIRVTDKSGTYTSPSQSFTAQTPTSDGFVQVSSADPRFFQYSSGKIYWPLGMTWGGGGAYGPTTDGIDLTNSVLNYDRFWMGGVGAYTSRWTRWFSTNYPDWGNEGPEPNMIYTEHYPGHELSQPLSAGKGYRIEIGWLQATRTQIKRSTTYQVKMRLKTVGLTASNSSGGLVVKHHTFWSIYDQPDSNTAARASMIPPVTGTHDWYTLVNRYTTPSTLNDIDISDTNFSIYLQNVTAGSVYVDEFSVREVKPDGTLGGEMIASALADQHTYVDQMPMKYFDDHVVAGEKNGVHVRFVVHDKNDWIQNHLSSQTGQFVKFGDGYYQQENTKATWLQKQWWRYLVARLGYSTGLFGLEMNNEGPPDDGTGTHARSTGIFTKWVHNLDMHPHLNGTSFWCCWEPTFWGDKTKYPYLDFGDIHHYVFNDDIVAAHLEDAIPVQTDNIKRPVVIGERGLVGADNLIIQQLQSNNKGTWYHDMLWSQLHSSSVFEIGYWYPEHVKGFSRETFTVPFANFVSNLDVNQGGYVDIAATSGNTALQVFGQKNLSKNSAYAWVRNSRHTWKAVEANTSISPISTNVTIKLNPSRTYTVTWYNTYTGATISTQNVNSDGSGNISLSVNNLTDDIAFKLN